jgi:hypothetical protein
MSPDKAIRLIQKNLSPDLLQGRWKKQSHPLQGYCYVGAEALWHLLGKVDWKPMCATYSDSGGRATHWWLEHRRTKVVKDPTVEQFEGNPPYHLGRGAMFLTQQPSKRAQTVLDRINHATKTR